ncbi:MAG: DNA polymerase III subunit alpha [Anaerovoracaceae bacterium]
MIHLHTHTKYSLLDSTIEIDELIATLKEMNQCAIAITEHGNLYSNIEAYKKITNANIKYIMGCEMYICDDVTVKSKDSKYNHLVLLVKNEIGRLNLQQLVSLSTQYKYYGKPRIDFEMLKQYSDGLICLSACMAGEVSRALECNNIDEANEIVKKYKKLFGDDYYLEYQSHSDKVQQNLNKQIVDLAIKNHIKYIVTCDAHYLNKEHQKYHNVFVKIGTTREVGETYNDCYIQSKEDVLRICASTHDYNETAIANVYEIMEKCNVEIPLSEPIIPHVEIPNDCSSEIDYLRYLCNVGWKRKKLNKLSKDEQKIYRERANYEISAIEKMGFEGYYLLIQSYVSSVIRRGIARGSGGGSLIAYLCGIVDIDPVKYGLYFERFIDVGAVKLLEEGKITKRDIKIPDFDIDFSPRDRDKVIQSIVDTYGESNVVALGSFMNIWAKGAIKDIGKVLNIPFDITNEITKNLHGETIDEAMTMGLLDDYKDKYPELFEYADKLSGLPKSFSMHPCGKVVCMNPATFYNAVELSESGEYVLQGDMHTADDLGLVKMDVLGLRTIDVIYDTLDMIGKDYEYIAPHNIDLYDNTVWEQFSSGNTSGIFQFESDGMKQVLRDMHCDTIENLTAANALYRPGSKQYIPNFVNRKSGIEEVVYLHDDLKPILSNTYGIIVFQEQLIEIGRLANLKNPDELRQATAKKNPKLMAKIEPELKEGLYNRQWTKQQVSQLWDDMLIFAKYSFNKSHSAAYALIAYICMFLKTKHPCEYIAAWINSYDGDVNNIVKCIDESNRMLVHTTYGSLGNLSGKTVCANGEVQLGTNTIKFCNENVAEKLNEIYSKSKTLEDFLVNTYETSAISKLEILIKLEFLNKYGEIHELLTKVEIFNKWYNRKQINKNQCEIPHETMMQFCEQETEKLYKGLDTIGIINHLYNTTKFPKTSIRNKIDYQLEFLGYVQTTIPSLDSTYAYVVDVNSKYKNRVITLYRLNTGETEAVKVKAKQFEENPISKGDIIKTIESSEEKRWKRDSEGGYYQIDERETILRKWSFVN